MNVRKHKKKVTEVMNEMREFGPMNTVEIRDWINDRSHYGVTTNWVGNIMRKSGCFEEVGVVKIRSISGRLHTVKMWMVIE
jgi:hypothetical protein